MNNLNEVANKYNRLREEFYSAESKLRCQIVNLFKSALDATESKVVSLLPDGVDQDDVCLPTISYDGGNHPEYASNCYSTVYDIHYTSNGEVAVNCDDSDDYEVNRIWSIQELAEIADSLIFVLN